MRVRPFWFDTFFCPKSFIDIREINHPLFCSNVRLGFDYGKIVIFASENPFLLPNTMKNTATPTISFAARYDSPLGKMTMASDGKHLTGLWFDGQKYFPDLSEIAYVDCKKLPVFAKTKKWLDMYFSGWIPTFTPPLLLQTTGFSKTVLEYLLTIPYGHIETYGNIAQALKCNSAQAIGRAISRNPISLIIPCHRVIGSDHSLTGYSGGMERKIYLLKKEKSWLV